MIELTESPIDVERVLQAVHSSAAGAVVLFLGTTREFTGERQTLWLDYECFAEMALREITLLEAEARQKWPIEGCAIVHRTGRVDIGETSVAIAVSSRHRAAAFEAGQWLIDTLKQTVPIWKQEHWADGSCEWVHPGWQAPTIESPPA